MTELPRWDIVPDLKPQEVLPIPAEANGNWCALVNFLYGAVKNYRIEVPANRLLVSKTTPQGYIVPGEYDTKEPLDEETDLTGHQIAGFFVSVGMRTYSRSIKKPNLKAPYLRLANAHDIDVGIQLTHYPGQHVLIPLKGVESLTLEREEA